MRILQFILLAVILSGACQAFGSMVVVSVDATNAEAMGFFVRTDMTGNVSNGHTVNFEVMVGPRGPALGDNMQWHLSGAWLTVYNDTNFASTNIISTRAFQGSPVPASMQNARTLSATNAVYYSFEVSTNHLDCVQFEIGYISGVHPAIINYRFALPTFIHHYEPTR